MAKLTSDEVGEIRAKLIIWKNQFGSDRNRQFLEETSDDYGVSEDEILDAVSGKSNKYPPIDGDELFDAVQEFFRRK